MRKYFQIFFIFFFVQSYGQVKTDTIHFTLHCLENEIFVEENLSEQIDSVYAQYGFNDIDYVTKFERVVVFGHTDSKGSKKSNQLLSQQRAEYVLSSLNRDFNGGQTTILGFGETSPVADNKTTEGRDKNRRVEVTIVYTQQKVVKDNVPLKTVYRDTVIIFEDSSQLKINIHDYNLIKHCLKYQRKTDLYDLFDDLAVNESDNNNYYNFGKVTIRWCHTECLSNRLVLSVRVPDTLVKAYLKEIKTYVKQLKKQQAKLQKHKDNHWYIDATTYCPFDWQACRWRCGTGGVDREREKRVRYVAKDGYRIVAASYSHGSMSKFRRIKRPKRKIRFKTTCPRSLPYVSIVAVNKNSLDTIYYASGNEESIEYKRRCLNCKDRRVVVAKFLGIKIHKRLLRRKYIFRAKDYKNKVVRRIENVKK
jgi:hypothetical protein